MDKMRALFLIFCGLFTGFTLLSSLLNLLIGNPTETHSHILDRAILTLIGSIIITFLLYGSFKNNLQKFFYPYLLFIALAMGYTYLSGYLVKLHPQAYRDILINDTIAYGLVYLGILLLARLQKPSRKPQSEV